MIKEVVSTLCDRPHHGETHAVTTRQFTVDGTSYNADLCGAHLLSFDQALRPFVKHARSVVPARQRRPRVVPARRDRKTPAETRAWWAEHRDEFPGLPFQTRGRIPGEVVAAWKAQAA